MKSPQVIEQLKRHQSLCRNQFLFCCQTARRKPLSRTAHQRCFESTGRSSVQKPINPEINQSSAFVVDSSLAAKAELVHTVVSSAVNVSAVENSICSVNGIWSKSDSAFTSFTNVANTRQAI